MGPVIDRIDEVATLDFSGYGFAFSVLFMVFFFIVWLLQERWRRHDAKVALGQANQEIERLADQERFWRHLFLVRLGGFSEDEAKAMVVENSHEALERSRKKK